MKNQALAIAIAAACLSTTVSASAQSYDYRGDRYEDHYQQQRDYRDDNYRYRDDNHRYGDDNHRYGDDNHRYRDDNYRYRDDNLGYRHHMRGAGPDHDLRPGDRLPMAFWGGQFRVYDWQRARLPRPMAGSNWVRVGDDYVQSSVSTGLITGVMLRH